MEGAARYHSEGDPAGEPSGAGRSERDASGLLRRSVVKNEQPTLDLDALRQVGANIHMG